MKHQFYTRAYIDFKKPEDVIEFAEFFDGHLFVSEKGKSLLKSFEVSDWHINLVASVSVIIFLFNP